MGPQGHTCQMVATKVGVVAWGSLGGERCTCEKEQENRRHCRAEEPELDCHLALMEDYRGDLPLWLENQ